MEQLSENAETAGIVLRRNNEVDTISTSSAKQTENTHRVLVGVYISMFGFSLIKYHFMQVIYTIVLLFFFFFFHLEKVLAQLNLALVSKSDASYSDLALRALFRLNNHNYVVDKLRNSTLMELLLLAESTAGQTYHDLLVKDKLNYVAATFAKARAYLEHSADEPGIFVVLFVKYLKKKYTYKINMLKLSQKNFYFLICRTGG